MPVLWNRQVPDLLYRRNLLQVSMLWPGHSRDLDLLDLAWFVKMYLLNFSSACLGVLMTRSSPAASPVWTTAHMDSARLTLALCCLSASKIWPRPQPSTKGKCFFDSNLNSHLFSFCVAVPMNGQDINVRLLLLWNFPSPAVSRIIPDHNFCWENSCGFL